MGFLGCSVVVVLCFACLVFLCLMVTPRFLSHLFSHMGEWSIETKRIDDRQSFKRVRHRQKKISDYLAGQASAWILDNPNDPRCLSGGPFSIPVDPPYELLSNANAVILGPHMAGKVMLILQESLGCNKLQLAGFLRWNNGSHASAIRNLALATSNVTTPLTVEYLTPANDASGRMYATQICAQRLGAC